MDLIFLLGVALGLSEGIVNNMGIVFQKLAINRLPEGKKVTRGLLKNKMWLFGFIMNGYLSMPFAVAALALIGPALLPGLDAFGLIFLAIGSLKILKEHLKASEIIGIIMMVTAILFLIYSGLSITIENYQYVFGSDLFNRVLLFTLIVALGSLCYLLLRRRTSKGKKAILYALDSGFMSVVNSFWFAVLLGIVAHIISGTFPFGELYVLAGSIPLLIYTNFIGIYWLQKSFEFGQASIMRPIEQAPTQIAPIFYYFAVYMLAPVEFYSLPFAVTGISLVLVSMYLLSKRQASLRDIE
nr:DMT family transporter [Candidatus Njordarchaeota archaeon]